jgi:hypothetical protein
MLYITVEKEEAQNYTWYVGEKLPYTFTSGGTERFVTNVQADGDELEWLQREFTHSDTCTIPMPRSRVVQWYGDIAKSIVAAIPKHLTPPVGCW